jgi:hypothetical protein
MLMLYYMREISFVEAAGAQPPSSRRAGRRGAALQVGLIVIAHCQPLSKPRVSSLTDSPGEIALLVFLAPTKTFRLKILFILGPGPE